MCGLLGFITTETNAVGSIDRKDYIKQMLIVDTIRGDDSAGLFFVPVRSQVGASPDWIKKLGTGHDMVNDPLYIDKMTAPGKYRCVIGHNRAATQGSVNTDNAHPFQEGPITMVHNGTLRDDDVLPRSMLALGVEVDSHAVCHNLALVGSDAESVNSVVSKIDGAFTLIWHDSRDDSVNVVRNDERPFHMVEDKNTKTLYFASEALMMQMVLDRNSIPTVGDYFSLEPGVQLKWLPGKLRPNTYEMDLCPQWTQYNGVNGMSGYDTSWEPVTYTPPTSAARTTPLPPSKDQVHVGGKLKDIPMVLQNQLLEYDLTVADRLGFRPESYKIIDEKAGTCTVTGTLLHDDSPAIIQVISKSSILPCMKRNWLVRPIAVRSYGGDVWGVIVVRMVSAFLAGGMEFMALADQPEPLPEAEVVEDDTATFMADDFPFDRGLAGDDMMFAGPGNVMMGVADWADATECGCKHCGIKPAFQEAEDLMWMGGQYDNTFLCTDCVDLFDQMPAVQH